MIGLIGVVSIDLKPSGVEMVAVLVGDGGGEKLECAVVKESDPPKSLCALT